MASSLVSDKHNHMSFLSNLGWRFATKKFDTDRKLTDESVGQILDSIRMAPTSFGLQSFHVSVVSDEDVKRKLSAASFGQPQPSDASHVLVFSSRTDIRDRVDSYVKIATGDDTGSSEQAVKMAGMFHQFADRFDGDTGREWAARQAYIALGFALAAAAELEIDSCAMEGADFVAIRDVLDLPEGFTPVVMLPLGYRADGPAHPKARFPTEDLFTEIR